MRYLSIYLARLLLISIAYSVIISNLGRSTQTWFVWHTSIFVKRIRMSRCWTRVCYWIVCLRNRRVVETFRLEKRASKDRMDIMLYTRNAFNVVWYGSLKSTAQIFDSLSVQKHIHDKKKKTNHISTEKHFAVARGWQTNSFRTNNEKIRFQR